VKKRKQIVAGEKGRREQRHPRWKKHPPEKDSDLLLFRVFDKGGRNGGGWCRKLWEGTIWEGGRRTTTLNPG